MRKKKRERKIQEAVDAAVRPIIAAFNEWLSTQDFDGIPPLGYYACTSYGFLYLMDETDETQRVRFENKTSESAMYVGIKIEATIPREALPDGVQKGFAFRPAMIMLDNNKL